MFQARDTFAHFLADNLTEAKVHLVTRDPDDSSSDVLALNAVNIEFLGVNLATSISSQQVSIDIVADSTEVAVTWLKAVGDLLRAAYYTPLYDYSTPDTPVPQNSNLMWDDKIYFRLVHSENYVHYSAILNLRFH